MRPIEHTGMINRTPDFAQIQHAEDQKAVVTQSNMQTQMQKQVERNSEVVIKKEDANWNAGNSFDARDKGRNEYFKNEKEKKKSKKEDGKVTVKSPVSFDIKI